VHHCEEADDCVCGVQQGYESRHVTAAVGYKAALAFIEAKEDFSLAAIRACLSCAFDVLPITEVGVCGCAYMLLDFWADPATSPDLQASSVLHSVLVRGIDTGTISMCGCFGQTLRVPIVPLDYLCDFFKSEEVRVFKISRGGMQEANGQRSDWTD
jgi:hypothetical protein